MENKEFFIESDGLRIHAKLDYPEGFTEGGKCPLLILEHGLTGHMEERHITGIAGYVVSLGYAVLRVELYGHGKSDGDFSRHTVWKWVDQMLDVISYAAHLDFVTDLYLAGHSQGGLTTMLVAGMERDRLKAIIPLAPAIVICDMGKHKSVFGQAVDPDHIPDTFMMGPRVFTSDYLRTAAVLPLEDCIKAYDKPVLIVHADTDEAVPVKYAYEAAQKYADCTLKIIEGDTHCYDRHLDQVYEAIRDFLEKL